MEAEFRLLFVGDVVGPAGRAAVRAFVPELRRDLRLDAVIVNGENAAADGFGITPANAQELLAAADFITLGDHALDHEEIGPFLDQEPHIIRPENIDGPETSMPGRCWATVEVAGGRVGVVNVLRRIFVRPTPESPFVAAERALRALEMAGAHCVIVDMQAEATSEKQAMELISGGPGRRRPGHAHAHADG